MTTVTTLLLLLRLKSWPITTWNITYLHDIPMTVYAWAVTTNNCSICIIITVIISTSYTSVSAKTRTFPFLEVLGIEPGSAAYGRWHKNVPCRPQNNHQVVSCFVKKEEQCAQNRRPTLLHKNQCHVWIWTSNQFCGCAREVVVYLEAYTLSSDVLLLTLRRWDMVFIWYIFH